MHPITCRDLVVLPPRSASPARRASRKARPSIARFQRHDPRITDKGAVEYTEATYQVSVGNMLLVYGRRQDGQPFIAALYNSNSWGGVLTLPREIATPAPVPWAPPRRAPLPDSGTPCARGDLPCPPSRRLALDANRALAELSKGARVKAGERVAGVTVLPAATRYRTLAARRQVALGSLGLLARTRQLVARADRAVQTRPRHVRHRAPDPRQARARPPNEPDALGVPPDSQSGPPAQRDRAQRAVGRRRWQAVKSTGLRWDAYKRCLHDARLSRVAHAPPRHGAVRASPGSRAPRSRALRRARRGKRDPVSPTGH